MTQASQPAKERKPRARRIASGLEKAYPDAACSLSFGSPLELLIATILSAQSTDVLVNKVTPVLFAAYPTAELLAGAPREKIENLVHATGFFRQKAKSVQGACDKIMTFFGGEVPQTLADLITLPGVARKTANVVLGTAFGVAEGFVVDTHVGRLAQRLDLTWRSKDSKDAVKIERDLMDVFPRKRWVFLGHALVLHGRAVCPARRPVCDSCPLARLCPKRGA